MQETVYFFMVLTQDNHGEINTNEQMCMSDQTKLPSGRQKINQARINYGSDKMHILFIHSLKGYFGKWINI
jgi:phosphopantetheine adenylyltransferase